MSTRPRASRGVQPAAHGPHVARKAMNVAQHKIVNLLKTIFFSHQFSLMFVDLICSPRQLFFQCSPETPKGWTPLKVCVSRVCLNNPVARTENSFRVTIIDILWSGVQKKSRLSCKILQYITCFLLLWYDFLLRSLCKQKTETLRILQECSWSWLWGLVSFQN